MSSSDVATIMVALGGWVLAGITAWLGYRTKAEETFFHALDWLSGGTQKRNLGIAAVEGYWAKMRFRRLSTPLLCNSAIYLLLHSDEGDSPNELNNLYRMMELLSAEYAVPKNLQFHYRQLQSALDHKGGKVAAGGLEVPAETLCTWQRRIGRIVARFRSV